jgi:hypothetical protein
MIEENPTIACAPNNRQPNPNLETFPWSSVRMNMPVWFLQDEETLYIHTVASSCKVKCIRINVNVNITPCKIDGTPSGSWVPANTP